MLQASSTFDWRAIDRTGDDGYPLRGLNCIVMENPDVVLEFRENRRAECVEGLIYAVFHWVGVPAEVLVLRWIKPIPVGADVTNPFRVAGIVLQTHWLEDHVSDGEPDLLREIWMDPKMTPEEKEARDKPRRERAEAFVASKRRDMRRKAGGAPGAYGQDGARDR